MLTPTHIAAGYLISKILANNSNLQASTYPLITELTIIGSLAPDIDALFAKEIKDHRNTPFHAPLAWLSFFLIIYSISFVTNNKQMLIYCISSALGVFSHLFLDWSAGRTCGIRIFYPFSKRQYGLLTLNPIIGAVPIFPNKKNLNQYLEFAKFYFTKNKFLVVIELLIILVAILVWIK